MSLNLTVMRLESSPDRIKQFIDNNLEEWLQDEILMPTQSLAYGEGLSDNAIASIQIEKTDFLKAKLVWDLFGENGEPLSIYLEEGTQAHDIEAKGSNNGGSDYLMWYGRDGRPIFRKKVRHPGTTGKHILKRGWDNNRSNLSKRIILEVNRWLQIERIS